MEIRSQPRSDLMVFTRKEVSVLIALLGLVALFSFTLGLRLGREIAVTSHPVAQEGLAETTHREAADKSHAPKEHGSEPAAAHGALEHAEKAVEDDLHTVDAPAAEKAGAAKPSESHEVDTKIDAEFAGETAKAKTGAERKTPTALPKDKKAALDGNRFTLQVGAHRTVGEAAEQVAVLKRAGLEAFYIEASVPGKGTWYRVGIGLFETREAAEKAGKEWKAEKSLPPFLVQKVSE